MLDLKYWPSDATAQHISVHDGADDAADGTSTDLGSQLLSYADFSTFSLLAADPQNQTAMPVDYVMSGAKQRAQEAARRAHEAIANAGIAATYSSELAPSAIAADSAPKPATEGGDGGDGTTRRHSPPIR